MSGVLADLRHAFRLYAKTPASSAFAVVGLAAALAIETAFLSLWSVLELTPRAGFEARRNLITITRNDGGRIAFPLNLDVIERIDTEASTIDSAAGVLFARQTLDLDEKVLEVATELVTARFFEDVGPAVLLGRPFSRTDHVSDAAPVAIVSYNLWQRELGGRDDVIGQPLRIRGRNPLYAFFSDTPETAQDYRVIGVLGPRMRGTFNDDVEVWLPFEQVWGALGESRPANTMLLSGLARLADGVSLESARAELEARFGPRPEDVGILATGKLDATAGVVANVTGYREVRRQVRLFLAGSGLLALTAACNVSLFLLSRAPGRRRELAIRTALGALRLRLARQLLTESSLLVVAAALIGFAASIWLAAKLPSISFLRQLRWPDVSVLEWRVLALAAGVALLLTVVVSLAPIAGLGRIGLETSTRRGQRGGGLGQRLVGAAQVALATIVGAAAITYLWHLAALSYGDRGFSSANIHVLRPEAPAQMRRADLNPDNLAARNAAGVAELERRRTVLSSLPGVEAVTFGTAVPATGGMTMLNQAAAPDDPTASIRFDEYMVDPSYFAVLGIRLRHGRMFQAGEPDQVVVNETLARTFFGRTDVTGELIPVKSPVPQATPPRREIVGVIPDIPFAHPQTPMQPMAFRLLSGSPTGFDLIVIKSALPGPELRRLIEQRIEAGEMDLKIAALESLDEAVSRQLAPDRARSMLTAVAAVVVLLLTATGYYGTQHYLVAAGRRDYAILAALGAGPRKIYRLVLWRGLRYGLPGLLVGAPLAIWLIVWLRDGYVTRAVSPTTVAVLVAGGIAGLLLTATSGPAREARDLKPAPLLKED